LVGGCFLELGVRHFVITTTVLEDRLARGSNWKVSHRLANGDVTSFGVSGAIQGALKISNDTIAIPVAADVHPGIVWLEQGRCWTGDSCVLVRGDTNTAEPGEVLSMTHLDLKRTCRLGGACGATILNSNADVMAFQVHDGRAVRITVIQHAVWSPGASWTIGYSDDESSS
jgi:hypothetical protein